MGIVRDHLSELKAQAGQKPWAAGALGAFIVLADAADITSEIGALGTGARFCKTLLSYHPIRWIIGLVIVGGLFYVFGGLLPYRLRRWVTPGTRTAIDEATRDPTSWMNRREA